MKVWFILGRIPEIFYVFPPLTAIATHNMNEWFDRKVKIFCRYETKVDTVLNFQLLYVQRRDFLFRQPVIVQQLDQIFHLVSP